MRLTLAVIAALLFFDLLLIFIGLRRFESKSVS